MRLSDLPDYIDRVYLGVDGYANVILDKEGKVLTLELSRWKAFKAAGGDVVYVGALPKLMDVDLVGKVRRATDG